MNYGKIKEVYKAVTKNNKIFYYWAVVPGKEDFRITRELFYEIKVRKPQGIIIHDN